MNSRFHPVPQHPVHESCCGPHSAKMVIVERMNRTWRSRLTRRRFMVRYSPLAAIELAVGVGTWQVVSKPRPSNTYKVELAKPIWLASIKPCGYPQCQSPHPSLTDTENGLRHRLPGLILEAWLPWTRVVVRRLPKYADPIQQRDHSRLPR